MWAGVGAGIQGVDEILNALATNSEAQWVIKQTQVNSQISQLQSKEAIQQGAVEGQLQLEKTAVLSGQQKAAEAAQGVDVGSGTPTITRLETSKVGGLDYATIQNNAILKSLGYQLQGESQQAEGLMKSSSLQSEASQELLAAPIEFFGSMMKAVGPQNETARNADVNPSDLPQDSSNQ